MNRVVQSVIFVSCMGLAAVGGAAVGGAAMNQPKEGTQPAETGRIDKKAFMAAIDRAGGPAPEHAFLEPMVGEFDCQISMWPRPGAEALTAKATSTGTWIMGKRFVQLENTPAEGEELKISTMQMLGYDKRTSRYFNWGIDSTNTYCLLARGTRNEGDGTFTLLGRDEVPGRKHTSFKQIFKVESNDAFTVEVHIQAPGSAGADVEGWFRTIEIKYARKK
jgi:hypothetical protein